MALVEVQRVSGGYTEHLNPFEVVIDDEVVGLLGPGESCAFEVTSGSYEIVVRIYWCESNRMQVQVGEDDRLSFRCETRANLLTDGYWATLGRRRYLRLFQAPFSGEGQSGISTEQRELQGSPFQPRRPGVPVFLLVAAGFFSLALGRGLGFLVSLSIIFIAVQVILAINFHLLAPRFGSVRGIKSHDPFRFRIPEELIFSGLLAMAGIASLAGLLDESGPAGWCALVAAAIGVMNVVATQRYSNR